MHKETIKRGEREYNYYTNIYKEDKIKNIFLKFNKNKKEENGFLNTVELVHLRTRENKVFNYKNLSFSKCKATDAQYGRAPASKAEVLRDMRVQNSYSSEMRVPSVAHKRGINA